jgi:hypothetical protein
MEDPPAADGGLPLDALDLADDEVRARFQQARRSGRPHWLWPEVDPAAWRRALLLFEAAARAVLLGRPGPRLEGDAAALGVAGYTSGMGPLLGVWLEEGRLEAEPAAGEILALHLRHNRLRTRRLAAEAVRAVRVLADAGIPVTVLKGVHTGPAYFPDPAARPLSDVDLRVPPAAVAAAEEALLAAGYRRGTVLLRPYRGVWAPPGTPTLPRSLRLLHADDPWSVDVQVSLDRTFAPAAVARLDALGEPEGPPWPPHPAARVLGQPLLTVFLAAHASESLRSLTLLRLVELVLVIRRDVAAGALAWEALEETAARVGGTGLLYPALEMAERLAEGTVPPGVLAASAAAAPAAVRRVVARLTPATAQQVDRWSLAERYMWSPTWGARLRQLAYEVGPAGYPLRALAGIYRARAWRLLRGTLGR